MRYSVCLIRQNVSKCPPVPQHLHGVQPFPIIALSCRIFSVLGPKLRTFPCWSTRLIGYKSWSMPWTTDSKFNSPNFVTRSRDFFFTLTSGTFRTSKSVIANKNAVCLETRCPFAARWILTLPVVPWTTMTSFLVTISTVRTMKLQGIRESQILSTECRKLTSVQ